MSFNAISVELTIYFAVLQIPLMQK